MPDDPTFLATAIEAVVRAGDLQMAHFGRAIEVSKKGRIDLVTEVDVAERAPKFSRPSGNSRM